MGQAQPVSDTRTDLLSSALDQLDDNRELTMRSFDRDCELSLRRHAKNAESTIRPVSDCRIVEPEHTALILECLASYIRIKSYTTGDHAAVMPGMLQTVLDAEPFHG